MKKLVLKKKPHTVVKATSALRLGGKIADHAEKGIEHSKLNVFDIPLALLVAHEDNPNTQSEKVFDELVERIRQEGFDEPIIVYPEIIRGNPTGKYKIASGHHRAKAAELAGFDKVPAIIREGWDEDRALIELTARNALRGNLDPVLFTKTYNKLKDTYGEDQLRKMMGLTDKKQFAALYKGVRAQLTPRQQKKLDEAKEEIKSVDDLSQVLNEIFREHGTKIDRSMLVFSFGGKNHLYIKVDKTTFDRIKKLSEECEDGEAEMGRVFDHLLSKHDTGTLIKDAKK